MQFGQSEDARVALSKQMHWVMRRHHQRCTALLEDIGIGSGQVPILMELNFHNRLTQRELAERVHVTAATVSGTLKRMERAGLVVRSGDEGDARISIVQLSDQGRALMAEAERKFRQTDYEMTQGLTDDQCAEALKLVERMQANLDSVLGAPSRREKDHH